jgi:hypothetical protein
MVSHYLLGNVRTVRDGFNFGLELWHTCAGPLGCLPAANSLVLYWPQGYLEHVSLHSTLFKSIMAFRSIKKNSSVCSVQVVNSTLQASVQPLMLAYDLPPHICISLQMSPSWCTHRFLSPLLWILWVCESWRNSSHVCHLRGASCHWQCMPKWTSHQFMRYVVTLF